jgi:hypothetical protein
MTEKFQMQAVTHLAQGTRLAINELSNKIEYNIKIDKIYSKYNFDDKENVELCLARNKNKSRSGLWRIEMPFA